MLPNTLIATETVSKSMKFKSVTIQIIKKMLNDVCMSSMSSLYG